MVISDTKRFIFLHNPKVAGTALRRTLISRYDTRNNFFWGVAEGATLNRRIDKAHMSLSDLRVVFPGDFALLDDYFVFVFVRKPVERYISSFFEFVIHHKKNIQLNNCTADEILSLINDFTQTIDEHKIRYGIQYRHFMPQHEIIYYNNKCKADFIGYLDDIHGNFEKIKALIGLELTNPVTKWNQKSKRFGNLHQELPTSTRDKILKLYEKDFIYFNFTD